MIKNQDELLFSRSNLEKGATIVTEHFQFLGNVKFYLTIRYTKTIFRNTLVILYSTFTHPPSKCDNARELNKLWALNVCIRSLNTTQWSNTFEKDITC